MGFESRNEILRSRSSASLDSLVFWIYLYAALFVVLAVTTGQLRAQTLSESFVAAYRHNPALQSQRYQARSIDETVPEALSGYRPKISGDAFYGTTSRDNANGGSNRDSNETYGYSARIEQPIFDGFRTRSGVSEAEAEVRASHQNLRAGESEILLQTATSYFDVLRDEGVVLYRRKTLTALRRELVGARERLGRGQATMTDVEQTKQRAALARSDLEQAAANLRISRIRFARVTSLKAKSLRMPRLPKRFWPGSLREAVGIAETNSPIIQAAQSKHESARHAIDKARGALLPEVTLVGSYNREFNTSSNIREDDAASVLGRVRVPLYQGGAASARIRGARHVAAGRDRDVRDAKLRVGEAVGAAWTELRAARRRRAIEEKAVQAGERALAAVREEQQAGRRTVLDVLDAERELVNLRIRLLTTQRDLHVTTYALLRSTGLLTINKLVPGAERYDPKQHYRAVRGKWWGTSNPDAGGAGFLGSTQPEKLDRGERHNAGAAGVRGWSTKVNAQLKRDTTRSK
ncbi:MAG: TolC family outer membrane protein [Pseudomonadota bacterium]